jgi:CheY-like chemotaxis protein
VGGPRADSKINVMDYHEPTKRFALGGYTACRDLKRNNDGTTGLIPLIMSYVPDNNGKIKSPDWGYTLALSGWSFY